MKKSTFARWLSGLVVSVVAVLGVTMGHAAAAGQTCTWTAGGSDDNFSTVGNWSGCGGAAPGTGDNLVFDASATSLTPNNNLSGVSFANITFTGSLASAGFTVSGNAFTVTGGITDNSTGNWTNAISAPITFSSSQTVGGTHAPLASNPLALSGAVTLASGTTVTFSSIGVTISGALSGSGTLALSGNSNDSLGAAASGFTGTVNLGSGTTLSASVDGALGTASVTIASGATLYVFSSQTSLTLANAITMGGTGVSGAGALNLTLPSTGTITLSGAVTLTANTTIQPNGSTVKVTGAYTSNGHVLSASTGSVSVSSATGAKTPNTGLAAIKSNPLAILAVTTSGAILLGGTALKMRKLSSVRR